MHTTTLEMQLKTPWRQLRQLQEYGIKFTPAQHYLGIGERAGNAETEKVLLNLYLHYGVKKYEGKTQRLKQRPITLAKQQATLFHLTKQLLATTVLHMSQESTLMAS